MSFIGKTQHGQTYAPGWFMANNEDCTRETRQITKSDSDIVPMGTIYPTNDSSAEGIVYEDVDVSTGDMPGSVVTKGEVYEDRLPVTIDEDAKTALEGKGFIFKTSPKVERPY